MGVEFTIPNDPAELWSEGPSDKLTMVVSDHSLDFKNETIIVKYAEGASCLAEIDDNRQNGKGLTQSLLHL